MYVLTGSQSVGGVPAIGAGLCGGWGSRCCGGLGDTVLDVASMDDPPDPYAGLRLLILAGAAVGGLLLAKSGKIRL